jgi:signal transduction histidine kinase
VMKNYSAETENELNSLKALLNAFEKNPPVSKGANPEEDGHITFSSSFLLEMVEFIKNTLVSIAHVNHLSTEKADNPEYKKQCHDRISFDIKKIDSLLNTLLNYIHINIPILKKNTVHLIIEGILEANEHPLLVKNIKIVKNFEKDLPETFIHDEQVRFILNSILQYAILYTPNNGSIGFMTKSINQKGTGEDKVVALKERKYIEVLIVSKDHEDPFEPLEDDPGDQRIENEKTVGLILLLIKELIQKSQGLIEFEVDERKSRSLFSLRLPCERRQVIFYEPIRL